VLVSFAPIWSLAPFLRALLGQAPGGAGEAFGAGRLAAVVACSSSSVLTKRFAANRSDRRLVERLSEAETSVEASAQEAGIPCHILRPTLIYGQAGSYGDRNLSRLIHWMGRLPLLPIPADTGLRQPIHARQLAAVALHLADNAGGGPARVAIGGDTCLSYAAMLQQLQRAAALVDPQHPASRCRLLPLPNRLFQLLAAPLLPLSAKGFEAVLRIQANLGPFAKAHELLGVEPEAFPVSPLAMGNRPTPVSSLDAPPEP
jgi:nucleoside-diphosphate-sugar epimerase